MRALLVCDGATLQATLRTLHQLAHSSDCVTKMIHAGTLLRVIVVASAVPRCDSPLARLRLVRIAGSLSCEIAGSIASDCTPRVCHAGGNACGNRHTPWRWFDAVVSPAARVVARAGGDGRVQRSPISTPGHIPQPPSRQPFPRVRRCCVWLCLVLCVSGVVCVCVVCVAVCMCLWLCHGHSWVRTGICVANRLRSFLAPTTQGAGVSFLEDTFYASVMGQRSDRSTSLASLTSLTSEGGASSGAESPTSRGRRASATDLAARHDETVFSDFVRVVRGCVGCSKLRCMHADCVNALNCVS